MALLSFLAGLAMAGFGIYQLRHSVRLRRKGLITTGTVTGIKLFGKRRTTVLIVHFKSRNGRNVVFNAGGYTGAGLSYPVGASVPVLYDPKDPGGAVIYTLAFLWLRPLFFTALGLVFSVMAFYAH